MILTHIGHAEFLLELDSGYRILIDPYDESCGYPVEKINCNAALVSHQHHDHNALENVNVYEKTVDTKGLHTLSTDVKVEMCESFHDSENGSLRGRNLISIIEAEGLRVAHLGDQGCFPSKDIIKKLQNVDLMMIPVGGYFTINADEAVQIIQQVCPRIVVPMHYKTEYNRDWPIDSVEKFESLFRNRPEWLQQLRVTSGDLECQPRVVILEHF